MLSVRSGRWRALMSGIRARVSLVFLSTAVPNGTVFEFSEWTDSAAHDLKGDALHALWGKAGMLLAGAAQYEGG